MNVLTDWTPQCHYFGQGPFYQLLNYTDSGAVNIITVESLGFSDSFPCRVTYLPCNNVISTKKQRLVWLVMLDCYYFSRFVRICTLCKLTFKIIFIKKIRLLLKGNETVNHQNITEHHNKMHLEKKVLFTFY